MAKNIKEITLYNFKAFYGENTIKLDGKNLLLYGENGSGKSSIYWAFEGEIIFLIKHLPNPDIRYIILDARL